MRAAGIVVAGLRKRYRATLALDGMSFAVRPGVVTGFVGPNGAGKSTTMRVILGLDAVDEGTALIEGKPYRSLRHPLHHVGSLLDAAALHPGRSARNHLLWLAHSQGLAARRVDQVIEQVGLTSAARRKAGGYSLGMRQRLGIAAALLGDPPIVMLDEPFNGMDIGVVAAAATVAVVGSLLAGRLILPGDGFTALVDGPTLRAVVGSILYLTLIALLSLGIAAIVRDSATSIGAILGLLYLLPILSQVIGDPHWQRLLEQIGPMSAGLAIQATTNLHNLPLRPWAGLGVTAGWAAAALVTEGLMLRIRDA